MPRPASTQNVIPIRLSGREVSTRENVYSRDVQCSETGDEEYFPPGADVIHVYT